MIEPITAKREKMRLEGIGPSLTAATSSLSSYMWWLLREQPITSPCNIYRVAQVTRPSPAISYGIGVCINAIVVDIFGAPERSRGYGWEFVSS